MSIVDDARLESIDRRGRAAARTLRDDLAARATIPEPTMTHLERLSGSEGRRPARRRLLTVAAVALLAAAGGAVAVVNRDEVPPAESSDSRLDHLLPGRLPTGFELVSAFDIPDSVAAGFAADVAVYGDPDAVDTWSATLGVVHLVADEAMLGGPPVGGEAVTVAGHEARLREAEGFGDGSPYPSFEVEWQVADGRLIVSGALTREEVLAAAEAATTEPAIDPSGLPAGYTELARGPFMDSMLVTSLFEGAVYPSVQGSVDGSELALVYADPTERDAVRPAIVVAQRAGRASAVDLLRLWAADAEVTTVRGRHAVISRDRELPGSAGENGVVGVQWAEPEGQIVTVAGFGVSEDAVLEVAEGLRPASAGELAAARDEQVVAAPREFGALADGYVVAASGESDTGQWRIVADARQRDNVGALTIERMWGAIGSTISTTGDRVEPPLDLAADFSDGTAVVWGLLWVDAASVTVEAPGTEPITLGIHEVEGWSHPVVAGAFPDDHFARAEGTVDVVARDAEGQEVGRNSTLLSPDG